MIYRKIVYLISYLSVSMALFGCKTTMIQGDSLVLAGQTPANLLFDRVKAGSVKVRSSYMSNREGTVWYTEGIDYVLDYKNGTLARTPNSRIPDYGKHILYGKKDFDHNKLWGSNQEFFVWVDYYTYRTMDFGGAEDYSEYLSKMREKLENGELLKIVAYGDSITQGGEATTVELRFQNRYVNYLLEKFPKAKIHLENSAIGGITTIQGIEQLKIKVLDQNPDLVLLGFGMNDQVTADLSSVQFQENLCRIADEIKEKTNAEIIMFSTFEPHPDWLFNIHRTVDFANATKMAARKTQCAYADVYSIWQKALNRKDHSSLIANNINHPNDFGHWLYFEAFKRVKF